MRPARLCGANFRKLSCRDPHHHRRTNSDLVGTLEKMRQVGAQWAHCGEIFGAACKKHQTLPTLRPQGVLNFRSKNALPAYCMSSLRTPPTAASQSAHRRELER